MASKAYAATALLLCLNLFFFTLVTSTVPCPPPPPPKTPKCPPPPPKIAKSPHSPPKIGKSPPSPPKIGKSPPSPPKQNSPPAATCPRDILKLGACAGLLNDLVHLLVGTPAKTPCCSVIEGLVDLEAALCLCTAIKANILGINLNVPVSLSLLLNNCGKKVPEGFKCA